MTLGILEMMLVLALAVCSTVAAWQRNPWARWAFGVTFCSLMASLTTATDLLSTLISTVAMTICLAVGAALRPNAIRQDLD